MTAGYAVPGAIIAIGVLAVFISLDEWLSPLYARLGQGEGALVLSMSLAMLITAYVIRFMASGYNAVDAGYEKMNRSYSEASRTLGRSPTATFFLVELPLLRGAALSGFILTFVEIIKELPLTWLLRPFNFETLSTRTYKYAIDERIYDAALPSLFLIGISLVSVLMMIHPFREKGKS
jgi:iron(III) transport system permease protein